MGTEKTHRPPLKGVGTDRGVPILLRVRISVRHICGRSRVAQPWWARSLCHSMDAAPEPRTEMCPSSEQSSSSAEGQWRASHSLCELGTTRSRPPWRNRVGAITCAESKPHGVTVAKSSSNQPAAAVLRRRTDDADEPGPLGFERNEIGRHEPRSADEDAGAS